MKKFLTFVVALAMTIPMMAIGRNDGSTKANAKEFTGWETPMTHDGGTKWYRVDLSRLYEEESPALNLFLANKSPINEAHTSLKATVAGQTDEKSFTIGPKQQKVWSANASMLVRLKQTEIYLTLTSDGPVLMSARVFEAEDLDETCRDALSFSWTTGITKAAGVQMWYRVNIKDAKAATDKDVCVVVTNNGSKKLTLHAGQSLDCPSSGVTKRTIELAAGQTLRDTIPNGMLTSVAFDELYVSLENDQPITVRAEYAERPTIPVMPADATPTQYEEQIVPDTSLHTMGIDTLHAGVTYYLKYDVSKLNALSKYEPEFTFRNIGTGQATIVRKMAFEVPALVAQSNTLVLDTKEESIEVVSKNTLIGLEASYIYVMITSDMDIQLVSRFKHVREGKACKTNIDFVWTEEGHTQSANTKLWYAIDVKTAKKNTEDILVHVQNLSSSTASVDAFLAFSCPYIDLQEVHHSIAKNATEVRTLAYSMYAMMTDTVWVGVETNQDIRFWVTTKPTTTKEPDDACLTAVKFNWEEGVVQNGGDTVWYKIAMKEVQNQAALFPTVFVQNLSSTEAAKITAELSLECPDSIENQKRTHTIPANESYSKQLSRNLFENISQDTVYLKVHSTQSLKLQIRLTEEAEGASCASAIPFNWVSGNTQNANDNLWYAVDLRDVMKSGNDIRLHIKNRDNAQCKGVAQLLYECPNVAAPSVQDFKLAAYDEKKINVQNSAFETLVDSIIYVNVQGTTGLRFWVEQFPPEDFDTIYASEIAHIDTLHWDSLYTQTVDTAWYIIPKSEIDKIRNLDEKVKPVAHLWNLGTKANSYKAEAAFAFPIVKKMMSKVKEVGAGKHFSDTIPSGTFDQILKEGKDGSRKDSIIIRVTRPVGSGDFRFRAELVKAFSGNSRADALPIRLNETYTQEENTEMWYKIYTADLKKDTTLYNKQLRVLEKNLAAGKTEVTVSVYEGLLSETELIEYYTGQTGKRTLDKGQSKEHNVPAQAVYVLGDVEMYIKVRSTGKICFSTKFIGEYDPITPDPAQKEAILVVPNVDYVVPGDNQEHWYQVCLPYIRNNYQYYGENPDYIKNPDSVGELHRYICASYLSYELKGTATIEATATLQDEMNCKMPVRKRTINKDGGYHKGTKSLEELINKAIKRAGQSIDVSTFQPTFVDSMLRRYVTDDSITGYVRIKTDKDLKVRLNMPQITGDDCTHPMIFDWEHGNVNPAHQQTWYQVILDSIAIPETCDLRLHVDNWSDKEDSVSVSAELYFDCGDDKIIGKKYKQGKLSKDSIDIDRDLIAYLGWSPFMFIKYNSDTTSHIWAELIPNVKRDTLRDTIVAYVCHKAIYVDTITKTSYIINQSMEWSDTLEFQDGPVMKNSITLFQVHPMVAPEVLTVDSMKKLGAAPVLVQGMQLFVDSSKVKLTEYYRNLGIAEDTIFSVDTVYWAKPVYDEGVWDETDEAPLDLMKFYQETDTLDTLLLVIKSTSECDATHRFEVVFPIEEWKYAPKDPEYVCPPLTGPTKDTIRYATPVPEPLYYNLPRYVDSVVTYVEYVKPQPYAQGDLSALPTVDSSTGEISTTNATNALKSLYLSDDDETIMDVLTIEWEAQDDAEQWHKMPYAATLKATASTINMRYLITTECTLVTDTVAPFVITVPAAPAPPCANDTAPDPAYKSTAGAVVACESFYWALRDTTIFDNNRYYYNDGPKSAGSACDLIYFVDVTIKKNATGKDSIPGCDSVIFKGKTYYADAIVMDTIPGGAGNSCDSIVTVTIKVNKHAEGKDSIPGCDSVLFKGKTYYADAIVMDTIPGGAANGCDSIVTVTIKVNKHAEGKDSIPGCDSVLFKGKTYYADAIVMDTIPGGAANGCDSIVAVTIKVNKHAEGEDAASGCAPVTYKGVPYMNSIIFFDTIPGGAVNGCDSIVKVTITVKQPTTGDTTAVECDEFTWYGTKYTTSGDYTHTLTNAAGCDSVLTMHLTINKSVKADPETGEQCNFFDWHGVRYTKSGTYYDTLATVNNCDSICTLNLTINGTEYVDTLDVKAYYGYRVIMINRNQINDLKGWADLDSLDLDHPEYVTWYQMLGATPDITKDKNVGTGYYYTLPNGDPLTAGDQYYAYIKLPASAGAVCGSIGMTRVITIGAAPAAPALVPSLARPGEDIHVINLDPTVETLIRIYTAEGLLQKTYKAYGDTSFTIKAAGEFGFYLVELSNESLKSTLRYIVK